MIAKDKNGDELLEVLNTDEDKINSYSPITHSSASALDTIRKYRKDRAEIESLSFYSDISDKSTVSAIAEKLLKLWQ